MPTQNNVSQKNKRDSIPGLIIRCFFILVLLTLLAWVVNVSYISGIILLNKPTLLLIRFEAILLHVTTLMTTRLLILFKNLPLLILLMLLAFIDGLVMLDIRKFQCARESALWFHRVKSASSYFFYSAFLFYLCMPEELNLEWVLMTIFLVMSFLFQVLVKGYKKYV